jgi:dihydroorotate dehydrogenase
MPWLRRLDPERAHRLSLLGLRARLAGREPAPDHPSLAVEVLGHHFPNPIGLAAGFDKDGVAISPLLRLGFGFIEVGTVTPRPQSGNPRPRLFRLTEDEAVINRMGMNGRGLPAFVRRLAANADCPGRLGANVGLNKAGADPERDYPALVAAVAPHADYVALNVSSPNTPGLRDLQDEARLRAILQAIRSAVPRHPPLLVKIAPDLAEAGLQAIVECCVSHGVAGLIVSNTTITRAPSLRSVHAGETGGLSGRPLFALANRVLAQVDAIAAGRLVLIGCGGIATGRDILTKLRAGASLIQLYTAFAYDGPALLPRLKRELISALHQDGFANVTEAIGADAL